jgi:hypothetical protein
MSPEFEVHVRNQPDAPPLPVKSKLLAHYRWGSGFNRHSGRMLVLLLDGTFLFNHKDTEKGIDSWVWLDDLNEADGIFGYEPTALEIYRKLRIPVSAAA